MLHIHNLIMFLLNVNLSSLIAGSGPFTFLSSIRHRRPPPPPPPPLPPAKMMDLAGLMILPDELQMEILSFLPPRTLLSYARTCKHISRMVDDPTLWRGKFIQLSSYASSSLPPPRLCAPAVVS